MDKKIEIPDAYSVPLNKINPADPALFKNNVMNKVNTCFIGVLVARSVATGEYYHAH